MVMNRRFELVSQERMPVNIVPLPEKREVFQSYREMFDSEFVEPEWKIDWIKRIANFETLNSVKKEDLHAALRWIVDTYEF